MLVIVITESAPQKSCRSCGDHQKFQHQEDREQEPTHLNKNGDGATVLMNQPVFVVMHFYRLSTFLEPRVAALDGGTFVLLKLTHYRFRP
jgi:hypothetical protein